MSCRAGWPGKVLATARTRRWTARQTGLRPKLPSNFSSCCPGRTDRPTDDSASPFQPPQHPLHLLGTAVTAPPSPTRPGDLRPAPPCPPPPGLSEGVWLPQLQSPPAPLPPPEPDTKESESWAPGLEQSDQQDLWPSLATQHKMVRQGGQATGDGQREFSTNLFFFRLRSFDSPTPQKSCHLPPPLPPAPLPPLLLAITHGDLTTSAPSAPPPLSPG